VGAGANFCAYGFSPTTTNYTFQLLASTGNDVWQMKDVIFTGPIWAIRASGTGSIAVCELL